MSQKFSFIIILNILGAELVSICLMPKILYNRTDNNVEKGNRHEA